MNQKKIKKSNQRKLNKLSHLNRINQPKNQPQTQKLNQSQKNKSNHKSRSKAVREYSSGGIVFRVKDDIIEILLLQDMKARWNIPKGHVESGETLDKTALREVSEETGITKLKLISKLDKIHFFYRMNGKLIFMTNFVYLIQSTDFNEKLQTEEDAPWITDVQWFEASQAYDILEYKATKVILQEAINKIKNIEQI